MVKWVREKTGLSIVIRLVVSNCIRHGWRDVTCVLGQHVDEVRQFRMKCNTNNQNTFLASVYYKITLRIFPDIIIANYTLQGVSGLTI